MTTVEVASHLQECEYFHRVPKENVIHICSIPNDRYISCERYIAKCKNGIVEFLATQHHGVCVDEFVHVLRKLNSESGKKQIEQEIQRINEQTELRIKHEQEIMKYL